MQRTGAVLDSLIRQLGIESGVRLSRIRNSWNTIFAEPLSRHMWPMSLSDGQLLMQVDSPLWMQQLTFLKQDIIGKLRHFGVRDVRFRLGRIYQKDRSDTGGSDVSQDLPAEDTSFIEALVSEISDEEIRNAVKKAAEKSLRASAKKRRKKTGTNQADSACFS